MAKKKNAVRDKTVSKSNLSATSSQSDRREKLSVALKSSDTYVLSYGRELSQIRYFALCLLPLLSAFSLLSAHYFVSRFLIAPALAMIPPWAVFLLALLIVALIEIIKYFLSPLFAKSLFFRSWAIAIPTALAVLFFGSLSIYFSVQGLQAFFSDADKKLELIKEDHLIELESLYSKKDSILQISQQKLSELKASFIQNPELLKKQEKYLARISYLQRQMKKAGDAGHSMDSIQKQYASRIKRAEESLDLFRLSAAASKLDLKAAERIEKEITDTEKKYEKHIKERTAAFEKEKEHLLLENSSISRYLYIFSFSVELLLILALGYIQIYRLLFRASPLPQPKESLTPLPKKKNKAAPSSKTPKRLSKAQKEMIKKRLLLGEKPAKLAGEFQTSERTIYRIKSRMG